VEDEDDGRGRQAELVGQDLSSAGRLEVGRAEAAGPERVGGTRRQRQCNDETDRPGGEHQPAPPDDDSSEPLEGGHEAMLSGAARAPDSGAAATARRRHGIC
jgi:hypothetical protein